MISDMNVLETVILDMPDVRETGLTSPHPPLETLFRDGAHASLKEIVIALPTPGRRSPEQNMLMPVEKVLNGFMDRPEMQTRSGVQRGMMKVTMCSDWLTAVNDRSIWAQSRWMSWDRWMSYGWETTRDYGFVDPLTLRDLLERRRRA